MKRALVVACALAAAGGAARGDAFDHIGDGAPVYVAARPVALVGALQRIGFDQLPAVQRLRRQLGGIDPFNPAILAAPGIDVAAPLVLSLFEPAGANQVHSRVAATLRDPATFTTFIDAVAASGQVKLTRVDAASPLGKEGVVATGTLSPSMAVAIRVRGSDAVLDLVATLDGKKAPAATELPRRFAMQPKRAFAVTHGARRLFAPEAAAIVYVDARRVQPLLTTLQADDDRRALRWAAPGEKAALVARQRARDKKCAVWMHAPSTFDDAALALAASPDGLSLSLAWGTQAGRPLGGLVFHPVDDGGLDAEMLARDATAMMAIYAGSVEPFGALKRSAPFTTTDAWSAAMDGCGNLGGASLVLRSWPLVVGMFAAKPGEVAPLGPLQKSVGGLRNMVLALRDLTQAGPHGAVAATFDASARAALEAMIATGGGSGAVTSIGKRSPTVYAMAPPALPRQLIAAIESLAGGKIGLTIADSEDSLTWAYRTAELPTSAPSGEKRADKPPILRVAADLAALPKLGPLFNAGRDEQQLFELLAHLRRADGELVADGDLLRLTLRSPLKQ